MSDLTLILLFLVCGLAVLTAVAAVLTPGRLFRSDPPPKVDPEHRRKWRVKSGAARK
jgi:hypothetical protein